MFASFLRYYEEAAPILGVLFFEKELSIIFGQPHNKREKSTYYFTSDDFKLWCNLVKTEFQSKNCNSVFTKLESESLNILQGKVASAELTIKTLRQDFKEFKADVRKQFSDTNEKLDLILHHVKHKQCLAIETNQSAVNDESVVIRSDCGAIETDQMAVDSESVLIKSYLRHNESSSTTTPPKSSSKLPAAKTFRIDDSVLKLPISNIINDLLLSGTHDRIDVLINVTNENAGKVKRVYDQYLKPIILAAKKELGPKPPEDDSESTPWTQKLLQYNISIPKKIYQDLHETIDRDGFKATIHAIYSKLCLQDKAEKTGITVAQAKQNAAEVRKLKRKSGEASSIQSKKVSSSNQSNDCKENSPIESHSMNPLLQMWQNVKNVVKEFSSPNK